MSEPQLERSVLEAKEREELFAIAEALGTRPTTRARKGDLVTAILRATGVEVASESEPPRRSRTRRAPSKPGAESVSPPAGGPSAQPGDDRREPADGGAERVDGSAPGPVGGTNGHGNGNGVGVGVGASSESPAADRLPFVSIEPVATGPDPSGPDRPASQGSGSDESTRDGGLPEPAAGAGSPANVNGGGSNVPSKPSAAPQPPRPRPPRTGFIASPDGGTTGSVPPAARGRFGGPESQRGANDQADGRPLAATSARLPASPSASAAPADTTPGAGSPRTSPTSSSTGSPTAPAGDGQTGGGQTAGAQGGGAETPTPAGAPGADGGEPRPRGDGETGNRRNRRRRGRDRGERNAERDLPTQNTDTSFSGEPLPVSGYLDLRDEGYGFLRTQGYVASQVDVYVSISQVRRFSLRKGDWIEGASRPAAATEKYPALLRIDTVGGQSPDDARGRPSFDELTAVTPTEKITLAPDDAATAAAVRLIDLFAPLGRGQRALLAGPPRSGKTGVLIDIVTALEATHPELQLLVLVVDERPEEVTELRRAIRSDLIATTFDRPAEEHVQVAELVIERAKRMVEGGADVVVVADGLTRLARAYNLVPSGSSRVLPGGIDAGAVQRPLSLFAAGRNIEDGGSLTLLATALVETGSRLDEVVYEGLTAAANMQVRLDRQLARRNVRPAIDLEGSWSRNEERLLDGDTLARMQVLRQRSEATPGSGLEDLLERLGTTKSNQELLAEVASEQRASEDSPSAQPGPEQAASA